MFRSLFAVVAVVSALYGMRVEAAPISLADLLDAKVDYQADFYVSSDKGHYNGRMVHSPGRERRDFSTGQGAQALLLRRDIDQAAMLWPDRKWYLSTSFQAVANLIGGFDDVMVERRQTGTEVISGEPTIRYDATASSGQGGRFKGRMWFTQDGILMKLTGQVTYSGKQTAVETGLGNLQRGAVEQSRFALPADYKGLPVDFSKLGLH